MLSFNFSNILFSLLGGGEKVTEAERIRLQRAKDLLELAKEATKKEVIDRYQVHRLQVYFVFLLNAQNIGNTSFLFSSLLSLLNIVAHSLKPISGKPGIKKKNNSN